MSIYIAIALAVQAISLVAPDTTSSSKQKGPAQSARITPSLTEETDQRWVEMAVQVFSDELETHELMRILVRKESKELRAKGNEEKANEWERIGLFEEMLLAKRSDKGIAAVDRSIDTCQRLISSAKSAGDTESTAYRERLLSRLQEIRSMMISQRDNSAVYRLIKSFPLSLTRAAGQACKAILPLTRGR